MKTRRLWRWSRPWPAALALLLLGGAARAETIEVQLLQLNDVYELTALPQVAGLLRQLRAQQPNTLLLHAGDLLSPSALGTAVVQGERLQGRQMVAVLNQLQPDAVTFGNHEFDLPEAALRQRLKESRFAWLSSNVRSASGEPLPGTASEQLREFRGTGGGRFRLGLLGLTLPSNPAPYVRYGDPITSAISSARQLRERGADAVLALTHQSLSQDQQLADSPAAIDLILGGHEHENIQQLRLRQQGPGPAHCPSRGVPIAKADANARSLLLHTLRFNSSSGCLSVSSQLLLVDGQLPVDAEVAAEVERWQELAFAAFRRQGLEPAETIATTAAALDGREAQVRNGRTNLSELLGEAMLQASSGSELALYNSGAIRIDDQLPAGAIRQYDVIRVLPFGGTIEQVALPGAVLQQVLEIGERNRGSGGYLQSQGLSRTAAGRWLVNGSPLDPQRRYRVAINDFLLSGREQGLALLGSEAPQLQRLAAPVDWRQAVIQRLRRLSADAAQPQQALSARQRP